MKLTMLSASYYISLCCWYQFSCYKQSISDCNHLLKQEWKNLECRGYAVSIYLSILVLTAFERTTLEKNVDWWCRVKRKKTLHWFEHIEMMNEEILPVEDALTENPDDWEQCLKHSQLPGILRDVMN